MFPSNEAETIELFQFLEPWIGWKIVHLQRGFPDAIITNSHGAELVAEFEFLSTNYRDHGHPNEGCDLIICFRDNWPGAPVPVWALEECFMPERIGNCRLRKNLKHKAWRIWELINKISELKREVEILRQERKELKGLIKNYKKLQCRPAGTISLNGIGTICIQCPREHERLWYLFGLAEHLPNFVAIREWMQTADIPSKSHLDIMLK